jgi:hypothetical protein
MVTMPAMISQAAIGFKRMFLRCIAVTLPDHKPIADWR